MKRKLLNLLLSLTMATNFTPILKWFIKLEDTKFDKKLVVWNKIPMWLALYFYGKNQINVKTIFDSQRLTPEVYGYFLWNQGDVSVANKATWDLSVPTVTHNIAYYECERWSQKFTHVLHPVNKDTAPDIQQTLAANIDLFTLEVMVAERFTDREAITIFVDRIVDLIERKGTSFLTLGHAKTLNVMIAKMTTPDECVMKLLNSEYKKQKSLLIHLPMRNYNNLTPPMFKFLLEWDYEWVLFGLVMEAKHKGHTSIPFLMETRYCKWATYGSTWAKEDALTKTILNQLEVSTWGEARDIVLSQQGYKLEELKQLPESWKENLLEVEYGKEPVR